MSASRDSGREEFDVAQWLESLGLGRYAEVFAENELTADVLPDLTDADLKSCGVNALGHRKKLLTAIAALSVAPAKADESETTDESAKEETTQAAPEKVTAPAAFDPTRKSEITLPPPSFVAPPPRPPDALRSPTSPGSPAPSIAPEEKVVTRAGPAVASAKRVGFWAGLLASKFLFVSIVVHLLFGVGATYFIVQRIQAKRKVTFQGGPPTTNPSKRALEHKVSMAQKKKTGGAPPQAKRIVSAGIAKVSLPDLPTIPTATTVVPGQMAGMGGAGFGTGMGFGSGMGSGMGGGGGGGGGFSFFGFRGAGVGLVGTFYDFKRDSSGKDTGVKRGDRATYTAILKSFASGSTWAPPQRFKHFTSKAKLGAKAFFFPAIQDSEAGDAFQSPESGAAMWVAHYSGTVTASVSGTYRFVGWGDNVMIAGWNGKVVLDASDIGYVDNGRSKEGSVSFPKKAGTPLLAGDWFSVRAGSPVKVDVLLGDEGGIFCAGLLLQKQGEPFTKGKGGIPELPLFITAALGAEEKKLYGTYLSEKAFGGPVFSARGAGTGSLLDALKR